MNISSTQLLSIVNGEPLNFGEELIITGITTDSRAVNTMDNLFIPLIGETFDGHDYIDKAFEHGCDLTLTATRQVNHPAILVQDTKKAMMEIAAYYRELIDPKVIAIVGSVGKTTTKEFIYNVLHEDYAVLKTHMNFNNEIGVPLTIFQLREDHEILILELGMNHFGEMRNLSQMAQPDYLVLTNIGSSHLGNFNNINEILMAKMEVLDHFKPLGTIILNDDDILLRQYFKNKDYKLIKYGFSDASHYKALKNQTKGIDGVELTIESPNELYNISLTAVGNHLVYNTLPAIVLGELFDVEKPKMIEGIESYQEVSKRMEINHFSSTTVINDAYNASFESMKSAIETLEQSDCQGKKVAILGEMLELGEQSKKIHLQLGKAIANMHIDQLICIGGDTQYIHQGAQHHGFEKTVFFQTKQAFAKMSDQYIHQGDLILLKGSRSTQMEDLLELFN